MTKNYVEYIYPGVFFSDTSTAEVQERDASKVQLPKGCVGFRFFSKTETTAEDGEVLKGESKNYSNWYYKGTEMSLADVKRDMPESKILISNMECNHWDRIVKLDCGQCFPLEKDDVVMKDQSNDVVDVLRQDA